MLNVALLALALMQPAPAERGAGGPGLAVENDESLPKVKKQLSKQELMEKIGLDSSTLNLFSEHSFTYTGGGYRERVFNYRLFVPEMTGAEKRPLLLWLHGFGEAGDENIGHLRHLNRLVFPPPKERNRYPFFVLAVQCPKDNPVWTTTSFDADDMLNVALAVLEKTLAEHPIDVEQVSLSGVSSGGNACWELASRRPELFSAVAPLASDGGGELRLEPLLNLPIWAFHSAYDQGTPVEGVRKTVAAIKRAGGIVQLTEVATNSHDCWHAAFEDHHLLAWLLAQQRGAKGQQPLATRKLKARAADAWHKLSSGWTPQQVLGQVGVPVIVFIAIWSATRRVRRRKPRLGENNRCQHSKNA